MGAPPPSSDAERRDEPNYPGRRKKEERGCEIDASRGRREEGRRRENGKEEGGGGAGRVFSKGR